MTMATLISKLFPGVAAYSFGDLFHYRRDEEHGGVQAAVMLATS